MIQTNTKTSEAARRVIKLSYYENTAIVTHRKTINLLPKSFTGVDDGVVYEYNIERRNNYAIVFRSFAQ